MLPDDPASLARIVADEQEPADRRRQALDRLGLLATQAEAPAERQASFAALHAIVCGATDGHPLFRHAEDRLAEVLLHACGRLQRAIAHRYGQLGTELLDDAPGFLIEARPDRPRRICLFDPARRLEPWLEQVIRRRWISAARSPEQRDREAAPPWDEPAAGGIDWNALFQATDFLAPFSTADLDRLQHGLETKGRPDPGAVVRDRVELLCLGGLWPKAAPRWPAWLADYEQLRQRKLTRPFPPSSFVLLLTPKERLPVLADLLGDRQNTLAVRWSRRRHLLEGLDYVGGLRP